MTKPLPGWRAEDSAPLDEDPLSEPKFRVLELPHPVYSRYVIDPNGVFKEQLSFGLSEIVRGLTRDTGRDYITALRSTLDVWAGAQPDLVDDLFTDTAGARQAILAMLRANNCTFKRSRQPNGSLSVQLLDADNAPARRGHQRIVLALLTLKHVFTALHALGRWPHENPLLVDQHRMFAQLMATLPAAPGARRKTYAGSQFVVAGRQNHCRSSDCTLYAPQILAAAETWPEGVAAATRLLVSIAARISEVWALSLADWAVHGFGKMLACPDKGSRSERVKKLHLSERDRAALAAYVDGPRAAVTGLTLAEARRRARRDGPEALAGEALFLGARGRPITADTYRDYYFRPAMVDRGLGDVVTPHRPRHEKAFRALTRFHEIATSPQHEAQLIEDFAEMMGWRSGAEMAHYYAPQARFLKGQSMAERLFAAESEANAAPPQDRPLAESADDRLLTAFREGVQP